MKEEISPTLSDLLFGKSEIFHYSESSCMPDIEIKTSQKALVNDLLAYATNRGYDEFQEGLDEELEDSGTRRFIDIGIEELDLALIVGRVDMYPEKRGNLGNLIDGLFPGQDRLLSLLFKQESPLNHISKEVRSLCWELAEGKLNSYYNMEPEKRIQFIEFISDLLFKNINLGRQDDTQHCLKLIFSLCGRDEFQDFQEEIAGKLFEIAENICQGATDYQIEQLQCINNIIRFIYQKDTMPSDEVIKSVLPIFELEFPYSKPSQKQQRNDIISLAAYILSRCNPGTLEALLRECVPWRQISTTIKIYGALLYADGASQSFKLWCAEEFKKAAHEITETSDMRKWVYSARGRRLKPLLSQVGVTKERLNKIFQDEDLAQEAMRIWSSPIAGPNREDYENEHVLILPMKDDVT